MASSVLPINDFESPNEGGSFASYQVATLFISFENCDNERFQLIFSLFEIAPTKIMFDLIDMYHVCAQEKLAEFDRFYTSYVYLEIARTVKIVDNYEKLHQVKIDFSLF